ncbi:MAG: hypothetical protein LBR80_16250, partial [Deltaproteobacteria bacterium]|nr:hypothetical protein [Deltaproteobacteria bacterium]
IVDMVLILYYYSISIPMLSYIISENHPLASCMTVTPMIFHSPRHVYRGGQEMLPTHVMFIARSGYYVQLDARV